MSKKIVVLLFSCIILLLSCNTTEPPPPEKTITLTLENTTSIEAWIRLTTTNLQLPAAVTLKQNNHTRSTINLNKADTLLYIDSLLPNQQYTFQISGIRNQVSSNNLSVTTMDTTSHDINWVVEAIGGPGSFARDVAIISENDIWIVGTFFKNGSDTTYNAAVWNGQNWQIIYIPNKGFSGHFSYAPLRAIFYVDDEIWAVGESGGYSRLKDGEWETEYIEQAQGTIYKIWGSSSDNLFFVGSNGSISRFNGSSFSLMNTTTDINITDIYGTPDGNKVWACGWNNSDGRSVLLRLNGNNWATLWERNGNNNNLPYSAFMPTLWTSGSTEFLVTGIPDGIVRHSLINLDFTREDTFDREYFAYRIRGDNTNNVYLAGDFSSIWHFNGASWKRFDYLLNQEDRLRSVDVKDGIVVAVGFSFSGILPGALIIRGRR